MSFVTIVYLFGLASKAAGTAFFASLCVAFAGCIYRFELEDSKTSSSLWRWAVFLLVLAVMIPDKTTSERMLVVYAATEVAQMDAAQELGTKSVQAMNKLLDSYLEDATE